MAIIIRSVESILVLNQSVTVVNGGIVSVYGTIERADYYFDSCLGGQRWMNTPTRTKQRALKSATLQIDKLNFKGYKASADQPMQFPRGTDTKVPVDIEYACYELAQALLKGVDPETEANNTLLTLLVYAGLRTEFTRDSHQPWMISGIPSKAAWDFLFPYLEPRVGIDLVRVS